MMKGGRDDEPTDPMPKQRKLLDEPIEPEPPDIFAIALASFLAGVVVTMLLGYLLHG